MRPIIKWPGGKSGELSQILPAIPEFERYIEPFFGGGALFFQLEPKQAAVNDISEDLMDFYRLVQAGDKRFYDQLHAYDDLFQALISACEDADLLLRGLFHMYLNDEASRKELAGAAEVLTEGLWRQIESKFPEEWGEEEDFLFWRMTESAVDKLVRTSVHYRKTPFTVEDLRENLITGYAGGFYLWVRDRFNEMQANRKGTPLADRMAAFYWVREYCYGAMFRYNKKGEFNIPYGGMSYNRKDFNYKVETLFYEETQKLLKNTELYTEDFETFLEKAKPTEQDFIFLDPPYDTEFSDYEGKAFGHEEQARLAAWLEKTPAKFLLVIKNTPFIEELYAGKNFTIRPFDNQYSYNVRSRNERKVEHLLITNYELPTEQMELK